MDLPSLAKDPGTCRPQHEKGEEDLHGAVLGLDWQLCGISPRGPPCPRLRKFQKEFIVAFGEMPITKTFFPELQDANARKVKLGFPRKLRS